MLAKIAILGIPTYFGVGANILDFFVCCNSVVSFAMGSGAVSGAQALRVLRLLRLMRLVRAGGRYQFIVKVRVGWWVTGHALAWCRAFHRRSAIRSRLSPALVEGAPASCRLGRVTSRHVTR